MSGLVLFPRTLGHMTGEHAPRAGPFEAPRAEPGADETAELIERIRAVAEHDPEVRRAVAAVVAELDRTVGLAIRRRDSH